MCKPEAARRQFWPRRAPARGPLSRGTSFVAIALGLAGCASSEGFLVPVPSDANAPGASHIEMVVATTRTRAESPRFCSAAGGRRRRLLPTWPSRSLRTRAARSARFNGRSGPPAIQRQISSPSSPRSSRGTRRPLRSRACSATRTRRKLSSLCTASTTASRTRSTGSAKSCTIRAPGRRRADPVHLAVGRQCLCLWV